MSNEKILPDTREPTDKDLKFTYYLLNKIADYIDENDTDRREVLAALGESCRIIFCEQTPFNVKEQCEEIDHFCNFLKNHAMGGKTWAA